NPPENQRSGPRKSERIIERQQSGVPALPQMHGERLHIDRQRHCPQPHELLVTSRLPVLQAASEIGRFVKGGSDRGSGTQTPDRGGQAETQKPNSIHDQCRPLRYFSPCHSECSWKSVMCMPERAATDKPRRVLRIVVI